MNTKRLRDFYRDKTVLVTGVTGFKGSWLAHTLHSFGAKVIGMGLPPDTEDDIFIRTRLDKHITLYLFDIREYEHVKKLVADTSPDVVFHLAAQPLVRRSYDEPMLTVATNVIGTTNVLEAVRHNPSVLSAVIVTTDKVYRDQKWIYGYRECDQLGGYDLYSGSKAAADIVTQAYLSSFFEPEKYGRTHKTLVGIARAGNVIGGGDWSTDRLVPDIMRAVFYGDGTVTLRHPNAVRPWEHVLEPISGYLMLGMRLAEGAQELSGAWNFGPQESSWVAVGEVTEQIIKLLGEGSVTTHSEGEKHETLLLTLDVTKSRRKLGWSSQWDLNQTLQKTVHWYATVQENPLLAHSVTESQITAYFDTEDST